MGVVQSLTSPSKGKEEKQKLFQHEVFVFGHPSRCGALGWVTKYDSPCCKNLFLFFLSKAVLKTAELPVLCEVVSSISQLSVPHFAMSAFTQIISCVFIYNIV